MRFAHASAIVVLLLSCTNEEMPGGTGGGGGSGGAGGGGARVDGGPPVPIEDYCAKQELARCAFLQRCGAATLDIDCRKLRELGRFSFNGAYSHLDCIWHLRGGLDAGRIVYHPDVAASCFAEVAVTSPCLGGSLFFEQPVCAAVFTGTRALGASCDLSEECGLGAYCESYQVCPGTCRAQAPAGGRAATGRDCPPGTASAGLRDGGVYCSRPIPHGASCADGQGFAVLFCAGENVCTETADGGLRCLPPVMAGQPVALGGTCAVDSAMSVAADGGRECSRLRKSGEPCGAAAVCQTGLACAGGVCGPLLGPGATCGSDGDCAFGMGCIGGACGRWGTLDAGCSNLFFGGDCEPGLFCNAASVCQLRGGLSDTCSATALCAIDTLLACQPTDAGEDQCLPRSPCGVR